MTPTRRRGASIAAAALACLVGGWLLGPVIGPSPPRLGHAANGDAALAAAVLERLGEDTRGLDALAVVTVDDGRDEARFASFGRRGDGAPLDPDTGFEIGSLAKPLTGLLLADLIDAGELGADTTLGEATAGHLLLDGAGADATLSNIARHRSGWPRMPPSSYPRVILAAYGRRDPYVGGPDDVLRAAAGQETSRGEYAYSNLGFAALGHALAVHEGLPYARLLERRLLTPLGLHDTRAIGEDDPLPAPRAAGRTASGHSAAPWRAAGWQPAGVGVWSTPRDLARLMTALLDGSAPGADAMTPKARFGSRHHVGYGWLIEEIDGGRVVWHNGGTGGFGTWLGVMPATGRGVAVLSNTTRSVDALGRSLLLGEGPAPLPPRQAGWFGWSLALLALLGPAASLATLGWRIHRATADRHVLVREVAGAALALALTRVLVPWDTVPTFPWSVGAGIGLTCAFVAALAWPAVPGTLGSRPRRRLTGTALSVTATLALIAVSF